MKYYTFSTLGKDGLKWYPKSTKGGFQGNLISDWTNNKNEAIIWADPKDFDCLMNEYIDTEIEIVEKDSCYKKSITITNVNNQNKFICFKIDGLKGGIMVGLYPNGDGLVINYKGDQTGVPFNADSNLIEELNNPNL